MARDARTGKRTAHGEVGLLAPLLLVAGKKVCATTAPGASNHRARNPKAFAGRAGGACWGTATPESSAQQLPGLQREASCRLGAIRAGKGGWAGGAASPLLPSQEPRQHNSRPAITRGLCGPLLCSSLAQVRSAVRTRKSRPPVSAAHYDCSARQGTAPPTSFHSTA